MRSVPIQRVASLLVAAIVLVACAPAAAPAGTAPGGSAPAGAPAAVRELPGGMIATGGPSPRAFGAAGVRKLGLDPTGDVNFLHTGGTSNSLAALASGQVAAAVVTPPYDSKARELGFHELLFLGDLLDF